MGSEGNRSEYFQIFVKGSKYLTQFCLRIYFQLNSRFSVICAAKLAATQACSTEFRAEFNII